MDEVTNLINVDDDAAPEPVIETPPAPVAATPEAPPVEAPSDPDEAQAVELPAGKHVPLSALKTVREENKALREKAQQADHLAQQLAQLQGQLQGYQQVTEQLKQAPRPEPVKDAPKDQAAEVIARKFDLYTAGPNGQAVLDTARASEIINLFRQISKDEAGALMQPVVQATLQQRAAATYQWALQQKDPTGKTVDKRLVDEVWRNMPMEYTADPQIAKTLLFTAMGMERMHTPAAPAVPPPPVVTEGVGGIPRQRPQLSALEQKIASDRGLKQADWAKLTEDFKPGQATVLE